MTIDLVSVIPKEARYPFWEHLLTKEIRFRRQIVILTNDVVTGVDYSPQTRRSLPNADFYEIPRIAGDWRNVATNFAIDQSTSDDILFLEPDFFIRNFDYVFSHSQNIGVKVGERTHPCFLKVSRSDIELTDKDFSAYPERGLDHFDLFTSQIKDIDLLPEPWYHMAGLTHNIRLEAQGQPVIYKPDEYYLYRSLENLMFN